jgi:hypothetical protein
MASRLPNSAVLQEQVTQRKTRREKKETPRIEHFPLQTIDKNLKTLHSITGIYR